MADEQIVEVEQKVETEISTDDKTAASLMDSWLNDGVAQTQQVEQKTEVQEEIKVEEKKDEEEILEPSAYLKNKFGWDNEEVALTEIKELREKATKGFEYKNDDSKKIAEYINEGKTDELYTFLDTKKKVEKLSTADVTNGNVAAELVKFGIQKDNPNLTSDDVEFLFNKKFSTPKEPTQRGDELDEEFAERHSAWEEQKKNVERELVIEAKIAQPKMAQFNSELVLPEIHKESKETTNKVSEEDLVTLEKAQNAFLESATKKLGELKGLTYQVKDKDVDYTVSYDYSTEEKKLVEGKVKQFVETGFNAFAVLEDRWASNGALNEEQIAKDLLKLFTSEKATQKLITDAANKRLEVYLNEKKQINVNETRTSETFQAAKKEANEVLVDAWLSV